MYGLGLVQNIDAAAMELYLSWRHFEAKNAGGVALDDVDVVLGGARVKF
jgi:hypothetical protein